MRHLINLKTNYKLYLLDDRTLILNNNSLMKYNKIK